MCLLCLGLPHAAIALEDVFILCGADVHARVCASWDETSALQALALGPSVTCAFCGASFEVDGARPKTFKCVVCDLVTCLECAVPHQLPAGSCYCGSAAATQEQARQAAARERLRVQHDSIVRELDRLIERSHAGTSSDGQEVFGWNSGRSRFIALTSSTVDDGCGCLGMRVYDVQLIRTTLLPI